MALSRCLRKVKHLFYETRYCPDGKPDEGALGLAGADCGAKGEAFPGEEGEGFVFDEDCGAKGEAVGAAALGFAGVDAGFVELLVSPGL